MIIQLHEKIKNSTSQENSKEIPFWLKDCARHWHDGAVDNAAFGKGIQYMISSGLIQTNIQIKPTDSFGDIQTWVKSISWLEVRRSSIR